MRKLLHVKNTRKTDKALLSHSAPVSQHLFCNLSCSHNDLNKSSWFFKFTPNYLKICSFIHPTTFYAVNCVFS